MVWLDVASIHSKSPERWEDSACVIAIFRTSRDIYQSVKILCTYIALETLLNGRKNTPWHSSPEIQTPQEHLNFLQTVAEANRPSQRLVQLDKCSSSFGFCLWYFLWIKIWAGVQKVEHLNSAKTDLRLLSSGTYNKCPFRLKRQQNYYWLDLDCTTYRYIG